MGQIQETLLPNGVPVLTEEIPGVRSATIGIWIRQGSAHEDPAIMGASHLLEHMVFKGTETRSGPDIAMALESLGGSLDAYTSREHTSFQARVLDEHLPEAMDVLGDIVLRPLLRQKDLEMEREVVLEEIAMVQDTPDDLVFELHGTSFWNGHPYGHAILGSPESVQGVDASTLRDLHRQRYLSGELIVAAAGNVHHQEVVERTAHLFAGVQSPEEPNGVSEPSPLERGEERVSRDSSQTHIVLGSSIPGHSHPDRYPLLILSAAFGGGMSSRLFQRIREELGLAYSVFSFQSFYSRSGISGVYVGTRPEWGDRAFEAILEEYRRLAAEGLTAEELALTKQQVKGQVMLSLESTGARLFRLAGFAVYDEPFLTLDELLGLIDDITPEDVARAASEYFDADRQFTLRLGP